MADFGFTQRFLKELSEFERGASRADRALLEETLATIAKDPYLAGRIPSFYDPSLPSYLYRSGHLVIHYRLSDDDSVEFLNVFWRRL